MGGVCLSNLTPHLMFESLTPLCRYCKTSDLKYSSCVFSDGNIHIYCLCQKCFSRYNVKQEEVPSTVLRNLPIMFPEEREAEQIKYVKLRKRLRKGLEPIVISQATLL